MIRALIIAVSVWVLDQVTKFIIVSNFAYRDVVEVLPFFNWVRYHNPGAAFSFLADAGPWKHWFFVCLGAAFSAYLIYELKRLKPEEELLKYPFGLILGGAIGNVTDRLVHGHVIDFIEVHYGGWYFPAFNVADSALFCGAALWIVLMIKDYRQAKAIDKTNDQAAS